jgi:cellulose synthase operon protein C
MTVERGAQDGQEVFERGRAPGRARSRILEAVGTISRLLLVAPVFAALVACERGPSATRPSMPLISDQELEGARIYGEELDCDFERRRAQAAVTAAIQTRDLRRRATLRDRRQRDLDEALAASRCRAIADLEAFLEGGGSPRDTHADALQRLAELTAEDALEHFLVDSERYRARLDGVLRASRFYRRDERPEEPTPDYSQPIRLLERIVRFNEDFVRIDSASYSLGFFLSESGRGEQARLAWLSFVCSERFRYTDQPPSQAHAVASATDPYASCRPRVAGSVFEDEMWLRIGDSHVDDAAADRSGPALAVAAYRRAVANEGGSLFDLALLRLAWATYLASHDAEAIGLFVRLVEHLDARRAGAELPARAARLRAEAIHGLSVVFADNDWDDDFQADPVLEAERLQDPALLPQDRLYTREVTMRTADLLFDLTRFSSARAIYDLLLRRWPLVPEAPELVDRIARCYERNREFEDAIEARTRLEDYGPWSAWARANEARAPEAVRAAAVSANNTLYDAAVRHHQIAVNLSARVGDERDAELPRRAVEEYERAAQGYRRFLERYPDDPDRPEILFNLADASFRAARYRDAATAYAELRDSDAAEPLRVEAALRAIRVLELLLDHEVSSGRIAGPERPPPATGTPPSVTPLPLPELLVELAGARDRYLELQPRSGWAPTFLAQTAQALYLHGHWEEARTRLERIFGESCGIDPAGARAWQTLVDMATGLGRRDEVERLERRRAERGCPPP